RRRRLSMPRPRSTLSPAHTVDQTCGGSSNWNIPANSSHRDGQWRPSFRHSNTGSEGWRNLRDARFLLAAAVDRPEPMNHGGSPNTDHTAAGKTLLEDLERAAVISVTEGRNNDGVVTDVEVGVACRKARIAIADTAGHRQRNDIG